MTFTHPGASSTSPDKLCEIRWNVIIRFFAAPLLTLENSPGALRPHRSLAGLRSSRVNPRYRFCISGSCCCCCACLWPAYSMGSICWLLGSCANSSLSKSCKYNEGSRSVRRPTDRPPPRDDSFQQKQLRKAIQYLSKGIFGFNNSRNWAANRDRFVCRIGDEVTGIESLSGWPFP